MNEQIHGRDMRIVKSVRDRPFKVALGPKALTAIQAGTMRSTYKGLRFCKNPFDIANYLRLIESLQPATIIEIGTAQGGSAVWMRDQCRALGLPTKIYTFDIKPPDGLDEEDIFTGHVDAFDLDGTLDKDLFSDLPKPWLIIEDCAHVFDTTLNVLNYFDPLVSKGDYVVIEDGVVADLPDPKFDKYEDGPNRAVREFLRAKRQKYRIDAELCDYYGHNVTYCPNAWLEVMS